MDPLKDVDVNKLNEIAERHGIEKGKEGEEIGEFAGRVCKELSTMQLKYPSELYQLQVIAETAKAVETSAQQRLPKLNFFEKILARWGWGPKAKAFQEATRDLSDAKQVKEGAEGRIETTIKEYSTLDRDFNTMKAHYAHLIAEDNPAKPVLLTVSTLSSLPDQPKFQIQTFIHNLTTKDSSNKPTPTKESSEVANSSTSVVLTPPVPRKEMMNYANVLCNTFIENTDCFASNHFLQAPIWGEDEEEETEIQKQAGELNAIFLRQNPDTLPQLPQNISNEALTQGFMQVYDRLNLFSENIELFKSTGEKLNSGSTYKKQNIEELKKLKNALSEDSQELLRGYIGVLAKVSQNNPSLRGKLANKMVLNSSVSEDINKKIVLNFIQFYDAVFAEEDEEEGVVSSSSDLDLETITREFEKLLTTNEEDLGVLEEPISSTETPKSGPEQASAALESIFSESPKKPTTPIHPHSKTSTFAPRNQSSQSPSATTVSKAYVLNRQEATKKIQNSPFYFGDSDTNKVDELLKNKENGSSLLWHKRNSNKFMISTKIKRDVVAHKEYDPLKANEKIEELQANNKMLMPPRRK